MAYKITVTMKTTGEKKTHIVENYRYESDGLHLIMGKGIPDMVIEQGMIGKTSIGPVDAEAQINS